VRANSKSKAKFLWNIYPWVYDMAAAQGRPYLELVDQVTNRILKGSYNFNKKTAINVLDICCGTGNFSVAIKKYLPNAVVVGIDFTETMVLCARKKNQQIEFIVDDAVNALKTFENGSIHLITLINGFYPLPDKEALLSEVHRVLDRGGIFILSDPHKNAKLGKLLAYHMNKIGLKGWLQLPLFIGALVISALLQYRVRYPFFESNFVYSELRKKGFKVIEQSVAYAEQNYFFVAMAE
jgi:ubiquinone/menaquinone biosynthesis C-methylase UbiE